MTAAVDDAVCQEEHFVNSCPVQEQRRRLGGRDGEELHNMQPHHLRQQFFLAALDALAHATFLWSVFVTWLAIADGDLAFVSGRSILVTEGAVGHTQLTLESGRLFEGGAHATAGAAFDQCLWTAMAGREESETLQNSWQLHETRYGNIKQGV